MKMTKEWLWLIGGMFFAAVGYWLWKNRGTLIVQHDTGGSTQPVSTNLSMATDPDGLSAGLSYFVAAQPYYFAPPVGNIMPQGVASRTTATNTACGC